MKKATWHTLRIGFFLVGFFLFAGIIKKVGWESIQSHISQLGWVLMPIFAIGALWYICYTAAWKQIINQQGNGIPFFALLKAKLAGEAINTIQPANFLGGDPMRIYLLRRALNVTCLTASVVVDRTINSMAIVLVIFLGAVVAFTNLHGLPIQLAIGTPIFLGVCTAMIIFFTLRQRDGLFSSILRLAKKLHIATHWAQRLAPKAEELDEKVLKLYQKSHSAFWECLFFHILGRLLGILEVYVIGKTVTSEFSLVIAIFLATLAPIVNMTFTFIPGALGVLEGVYSGALYLLGLDPALGLTIQLVKRIRSIVWIALGLLIMTLSKTSQTSDYNKDPLPRPL